MTLQRSHVSTVEAHQDARAGETESEAFHTEIVCRNDHTISELDAQYRGTCDSGRLCMCLW